MAKKEIKFALVINGLSPKEVNFFLSETSGEITEVDLIKKSKRPNAVYLIPIGSSIAYLYLKSSESYKIAYSLLSNRKRWRAKSVIYMMVSDCDINVTINASIFSLMAKLNIPLEISWI